MSINIDNYEQYVIDYLDGNLDEIKSEEMAAFLLLHPAIAEDLDGLSAMKLESEVKEPLNQYFISQLKKNRNYCHCSHS
jgi:anti-sigma factor RsiW